MILVVGLGLVLAGDALAQLTEKDIQELRERAKNEGWTFEINWNEACQYSLGELCGAVEPAGWEESAPNPEIVTTRSLPTAWDWRAHSGCTSIRNQGGCGSCWAFAAVGAVECSLMIHAGLNTNLSEQWLVSCTSAGDCGGGWHTAALGFLVENDTWTDPCGDSGPVLESQFPYVAWNAPCNCPYTHPYRIDNWGNVGGGLDDIPRIKQAIYDYGPVAVTVAVDSAFQAYDGGVFNACYNGTVNHAVVLVGWDDSLGANGCWILRNSWGSWWGDGGYMYIQYGCSKVGGNASYVEYRFDCNHNGIDDEIELANGSALDCNGNGKPDECDIARGRSTDCNGNGIPDECEFGRDQRVYVDRDASGNNSGVDWPNALTSLDAAYCFTQTNSGVTEVWVAAGTYTPCDEGALERTRSIWLADGVAYYGGFAGFEADPAQRDLSNPANRTILSGDLLGNDQPGFLNVDENSYHVLVSPEVGSGTILDGFVITGGYADGPDSDSFGGGLYNYKGSPTIRNCVFVGNFAISLGGGVCSRWLWQGYGESRPMLIDCVLIGNKGRLGGGAIADLGTAFGPVYTTLINCTLTGNLTETLGAAVYGESYTEAILENTIVWGNTGALGQTLFDQILGDYQADYCCVQDWSLTLNGTGSTGADPMFADVVGLDGLAGTLDDDLRVRPGSPCIDAGDNTRVPAGITLDAAGQPRFQDDPGLPDRGNAGGGSAVVDMGAFEFQGRTCFGDLNGDNQVTITDLAVLLGNYGMSGMGFTDGDLDGDGGVQLSDLSALLSVYGQACE